MTDRSYGRSKSGKVVTEADIERYAAEAKAGYDSTNSFIAEESADDPPSVQAPLPSSPSDSIPSCGRRRRHGPRPMARRRQRSSGRPFGGTCAPAEAVGRYLTSS